MHRFNRKGGPGFGLCFRKKNILLPNFGHRLKASSICNTNSSTHTCRQPGRKRPPGNFKVVFFPASDIYRICRLVILTTLHPKNMQSRKDPMAVAVENINGDHNDTTAFFVLFNFVPRHTVHFLWSFLLISTKDSKHMDDAPR